VVNTEGEGVVERLVKKKWRFAIIKNWETLC
jgi:hypothetical protein